MAQWVRKASQGSRGGRVAPAPLENPEVATPGRPASVESPETPAIVGYQGNQVYPDPEVSDASDETVRREGASVYVCV